MKTILHCACTVYEGKQTNLSLLKVLGRLEEVRHKDQGGRGALWRSEVILLEG